MTAQATSEVMNCIACDREVRMTFTRSDNPNVPDMVLPSPGIWVGVVRNADQDNMPTLIVACSILLLCQSAFDPERSERGDRSMKCPSCGEEHPTAEMKRFAERFITWLAVVSTFQVRAHESQAPEVASRVQRMATTALLGINLDSLAQVFQVLAQAKLEELAKAGKDPLEWLREMQGQLGPHESASDVLDSVLKARGNATGVN